MLCTGRCRWTANKAPFKRWPSLGESLIQPFFWFGSQREHLLYLQYIYSDSTNKELQRLIICVTHSLSHLPQIAGLSNEPGVPSWWICYRVVLLFMCALCTMQAVFVLYFPSWSAWLGVCTFAMLILPTHTHIQNTRVLIHNLYRLKEVCGGGGSALNWNEMKSYELAPFLWEL